MTSLDWIVLGIVALSILLAYFRGFVRELMALIAWVAGIIGAIAFTGPLGDMLPEIPKYPILRYLIAFAIIIIGALVLGAMIAGPIARGLRAASLGFVDRFLGGIFGLVRGLVVVVAFALVAGVTALPRSDWWQNSLFAAPLTVAVMAVSPYLPRHWTDRLDYSREGRVPVPAERKV